MWDVKLYSIGVTLNVPSFYLNYVGCKEGERSRKHEAN